MQRVQKLLSSYGFCSRRKAEELIKAGRVKVNDRIISIGDKAEETDRIFVDNKEIKKQRKIYLMFNKPFGCVTALKDKRYKTVMGYIHIKERVFPVGRLDYNTEGLLILTNDGDFANRIMHPRYEIKKTYLVFIDKPLSEKDAKILESGVYLEDGKTSKAHVKKINPCLAEITIHEGKKRIVRRMFNALGYNVKRLIRIRIGNLRLGNLKSGKYREMKESDKKLVFTL